MKREQIIEEILSVSKRLNLDVETECKNERWRADIVVNCYTYKVAFNICKSPRNVEEVYKAMREERMCGCWLLMSAKNRVFLPNNMPCFSLSEKSDAIQVFLNSGYDHDASDAMPLDTFIPSLIKGNIKFAEKMRVKYVDVCFFETNCWKCNKKFHAYFVRRILSSDGSSVPRSNDLDCQIEFMPMVADAVEQYVKTHSELGIRMGNIKPRFSRTRDEQYISFGCPFCDSIYGNYYYNDDVSEMIYCSLPEYRIEIPNGALVPANRWYKRI